MEGILLFIAASLALGFFVLPKVRWTIKIEPFRQPEEVTRVVDDMKKFSKPDFVFSPTELSVFWAHLKDEIGRRKNMTIIEKFISSVAVAYKRFILRQKVTPQNIDLFLDHIFRQVKIGRTTSTPMQVIVRNIDPIQLKWMEEIIKRGFAETNGEILVTTEKLRQKEVLDFMPIYGAVTFLPHRGRLLVVAKVEPGWERFPDPRCRSFMGSWLPLGHDRLWNEVAA